MIPAPEEARAIFARAEAQHGGAYAEHSRFVAQAARRIAAKAALDPDQAYVLGLLHDVGRCEGWTGERHMLDGYTRLCTLGYADAAKVCITHGFVVQDIDTAIGKWDMDEAETAFMRDFVQNAVYDGYDRLIQLCDALADKDGFCIVEKRLVDVTLRYGLHPRTLERWRALLKVKDDFDQRCGCSVYALLPGIERNLLQ